MKKNVLSQRNKYGKYELCFWIIITVFIIFSAYFILKVPYLAVDDYSIVASVGGIFGNGRESYTIPFMGVALTYLMSKFSDITGIFNTYAIFVITSMSISFFVQQYVLYKFRKGIFEHIVLCLVQCIILVNSTFTVVGFTLTGTGLILGYFSDIQNKNRFINCIGAGVMIFLGACWRTNSVYIVILFIPLLFERIVSGRFQSSIIIFIWTIAAYYIVKNVNVVVFGQTDIGAYYLKHNSARGFFVDRPTMAYSDLFKNAGWTENIYNAFYSKVTIDKKWFGYDILSEMRSKVSILDKYEFNIITIAKDIVKRARRFGSVGMYLIAGASVCFCQVKNCAGNKKRIEYVVAYLITYVLFLMLIVRQRFVERVSIPFFAFGIIQLLICCQENSIVWKPGKYIYNLIDRSKADRIFGRKQRNKNGEIWIRIVGIVPVVMMIFYLSSYIHNNYNNVKNIVQKSAVMDAYDYMNDNKDNLYIVSWGDRAKEYINLIPIVDFKEDMFASNIVVIRGYENFSEGYYKTVSKYNVTDKDNILYSLAKDENVFLLAPEEEIPEIYKAFMRDGYNLEVELTPVEYFDDENVIYSVSTVE